MDLHTGSLLGLCSPLLAFVFHILLYRLWPRAHRVSRQKLTVLVILFSTAALTGISAALSPARGDWLQTTLVGILFGYTYFHWFNMSETARRIRMLVLYVSGGTPPGKSEGQYDESAIFRNRIQRLLENGTIYEKGGRLFAKSGPLLWATQLILFWRSLFFSSSKRA